MKTLRRVFLEATSPGDAREAKGLNRFRTTPSGGPEKRAETLKQTLQTKADRNARAARTRGSGTSRPGDSSVSDSIVPLTSSRVDEMSRTPGTGPHVPASDRPGALKKIMKGKMSGERPLTPAKKPFTPGNVKRRDGSSTATDQFGAKTEWGR
jgi:hypothetical protein